MAVRVKRLRELRAFLGEMSAKLVLDVEGLSSVSEKKLALLKATRRDFLTTRGAGLRGTLLAYFKAAARRTEKNGRGVEFLRQELARGFKQHVLLRFRRKGGDATPMRPLKASTIEQKRRARRPHPDFPGVSTQTLYRNLERARFVFRRRPR